MYRTSAILLLFLGSVRSQDDVQVLIDKVFNTNQTSGRNPADTGDLDLQPNTGGGGGNAGCTCIAYYLCNNGTINKDGTGLIDIRIDRTKPCENYLDICCETKDTTDVPITPTPPPSRGGGCGRRNPDGIGFRITGDKDNEAQFGEFPWMVAVLREESFEGQKLNIYQCGGALIHPQAVLTAAHCVSGGKDKNLNIRAGEWDTQTKKELFKHQDMDVERVVVHKDYYSGALFNDVALLFLKNPVNISENVDVVCLPKQGTVVNQARCYASGWGKDVFGKEGKYQVILKKIDLPIVARPACQDALRTTRLGKYFELHQSFICAGGEEGKDTCKGDGGSPLVCPIEGEDEKYFQAGIVAWGIGCGENRIPGVYANVALFRNWIDEQMSLQGLDASYYDY